MRLIKNSLAKLMRLIVPVLILTGCDSRVKVVIDSVPAEDDRSPLQYMVDKRSLKEFEDEVVAHPEWINRKASYLSYADNYSVLSGCAIIGKTNHVRILIQHGADVKEALEWCKSEGEDSAANLIRQVYKECEKEGLHGLPVVQTFHGEPRLRFVQGTGVGSNCVTDKLTGLTWLKNPEPLKRTWGSAVTYCESLDGNEGRGGFDDWRLPTIIELENLFAFYRKSYSSLPKPLFVGVQSGAYWTSTIATRGAERAEIMFPNGGGRELGEKKNAWYVWPVRGGK